MCKMEIGWDSFFLELYSTALGGVIFPRKETCSEVYRVTECSFCLGKIIETDP